MGNVTVLVDAHALKAGLLAGEHRDPFNRVLAAQSLLDGVGILSIDPALSDLGAERIWE